MNTLKSLIIKFREKPMLPIFILLAGVSLLLGYFVLRPDLYQVASTQPTANQPQVAIASPILFKFNQPVPPDYPVSVSINPQTDGYLTYYPERSEIVFSPNTYLKPATSYEVSLDGPRITPHSFSFSTMGVPSGFNFIQPTPPDTATGSAQTVTPPPINTLDAKNQLISTLPHTTDTYKLTYIFPTDQFMITVIQPPEQQAEAQAVEYIKTFGFTDPFQQINLATYTPLHLQDPSGPVPPAWQNNENIQQ